MNEFMPLTIAVLLVLTMLIFLLLMHRSNLRQQLEMQQLLEKHAHEQDNEMDHLQNNMNAQMLAYQNGIADALRAELARLGQQSSDSLNHLSEVTEDRLDRLDERVNESILTSYERTSQSFRSISEQVAVIRKAQDSLGELKSSLGSLQSIFLDKKTRGIFGEVELQTILKKVFGSNDQRYRMQYMLSSGVIADCVLLEPEPLGKICIDSKFPLENYNRLVDSNRSRSEHEQDIAMFRRDVRKHISDIAGKYLIPGETADMAYMFVPAEAVFAEIYGHFDDVVQYAYEVRVFIVSPTTLMAYLTAIRSLYLQQEKNDKAAEIQLEYARLEKEFERFEKRYESVMNDYEKTYRDMNETAVTVRKILERFQAIRSVELTETKIPQEHIDNHA